MNKKIAGGSLFVKSVANDHSNTYNVKAESVVSPKSCTWTNLPIQPIIFAMLEKLGVFFNEEVQRLIGSFAHCFKVRTTIFSVDVEPVKIGIPEADLSAFCRLVRTRQKERCIRQDKLMCRKCERMSGALTYQCFAGPTEAVIPIKVDAILIGYAMIGQFRTKETFDGAASVADVAGDGRAGRALENAFMELPFLGKTDLEKMLHLFSAIVAFIVNSGYIRFRRPELPGTILHWLDSHLAESVTIDDIAAAVYRSPSTVAHVVKKEFGMSLKQLQTLKRMRRFESLITAEPDLTVAEAALMVGYEDALYFSRLYKKIRRRTPSGFKKQLRGV